MSEDKPVAEKTSDKPLVKRSTVPAGLKYPEYKKYLQHDFFYSCAYCTIMESEATAIKLTIDHYEPKEKRKDLEHDYSNLMYACEECNRWKGTLCPPQEARDNGFRFFRPDTDIRDEHFEEKGIRVEARTPTGRYTIEAVRLNRVTLRNLRKLRERLWNAVESIVDGANEIAAFPFDQLPRHYRPLVPHLIREVAKKRKEIENDFEAMLREYARSPLADAVLPGPEPEPEMSQQERQERLRRLREMGGMSLDTWQGRAHKRGRKEGKR